MKEEIWNIITKRLAGEQTPQSKEMLEEWLAADPENIKTYHQAEEIWNMSALISPHAPSTLPDFISNPPVKTISLKKKRYWKYGIAAASTAALFILGISFLNIKPAPKKQQWITHNAAPGKIFSITLPDSSIITLNAGSQISYAKTLDRDSIRLIKLTGEASFDVSHRKAQPFVVESGKIKTVVYGTSFNVRAYLNEKKIQVDVKSGKVGVLPKDTKPDVKPIFLLPNNRLSFDTQNLTFLKSNIQIGNIEGWKKGILLFDQTPIPEVLETLARRFNIKFDTAEQNYAACRLSAKFENKNLKEILNTIENATGITANQINQTYYLKGGNTCR